jgi:phage baseplate assembly protein W
MSTTLTQVYGRGWAFPPGFSLHDGVAMVEADEDVMQSLRILFLTLPGERIMRPDYGCDLQAFMFRNIREELIAQISVAVNDSILRHETRADVDSIEVGQDTERRNLLRVQVNYRLRGSEIARRVEGLLDLRDGRGISYL